MSKIHTYTTKDYVHLCIPVSIFGENVIMEDSDIPKVNGEATRNNFRKLFEELKDDNSLFENAYRSIGMAIQEYNKGKERKEIPEDLKARYDFRVMDLFGYWVWFTDERVDDKYIPSGIYKYELRHGDDDSYPCSIEDRVVVNFFGTVLSYDPIETPDEIDDEEWGFIEEADDIDELSRRDYPEVTIKKDDMEFCPMCKYAVTDSYHFCPKCGQRFWREEKEAQ